MSAALPSYDDLLALVRQQQALIEALTAEVARLRADLEEARRAGKRQAAPFRKGPPKANPKRPGRKAGEAHGTHAHRPAPRRSTSTRPSKPPCPRPARIAVAPSP